MGDQDQVQEEALPAGYWWSIRPDDASLFLRYGWAATVTTNTVRICGEAPLYKEIRGPCRSVEHGRRIVEKILAVRLCLGRPERREWRSRIRGARVRRLVPPPSSRPEDDDDWNWKHP